MSLIEKLQKPTPSGISLIDKLRGLIPHQGQPIAQPDSQLENVLSSSRALGEQVRQKVGQPLTRTIPMTKRVGEVLMSPGTELLTPRLRKAGISPFVAGAVGLGVDILAPGPGEVKTASKLLGESEYLLAKEARKYKTAKEFVDNPNIEYHLSNNPNLIEGKRFSEQPLDKKTSQVRGESKGSGIYASKNPKEWLEQFEFELTDAPEAIPKYVYAVKVKNPQKSQEFLGESFNKPEDVLILKKLDMSKINYVDSQLIDIWKKAHKK